MYITLLQCQCYALHVCFVFVYLFVCFYWAYYKRCILHFLRATLSCENCYQMCSKFVSRCSHFWSCQLTRYLFLEGPGNLTGLESCLVFLWDGGFKCFENCAIKLSAKENEWTGNGVKACLSIEILISKYGFGPVKVLELSRNGPQVTHGFCDDQRSLGYLL